jgi:two-component system cell cycle sensor histidine kinase/response regulator CckA
MDDQAVTETKKTEGAEALMVSIVETSNDAIYAVSLNGFILSWNPSAQRIYGFTPDEIIGHPLSTIIFAGRKEEFPGIMEMVKEGKAVANFATIHKTKRGTEVHIFLTVSPIKDASGRVTKASVIAREITENEKTRIVKEMLSTEMNGLLERLQLQMECMPIACVLADKDNHFTYWNPAAERTFGYFAKEVVGKKLEETILAPSDLSRAEASYERLQKGDMTIQGEVSEHRRKDGKTILCEWYVTPMRDSDGNLLGIMGMALDITERRKAEKVQSQLVAILQQSADAVMGSDLEGRIFSWNQGAEAMLGYHSEEIIGENTSLLVPRDHKEEMERLRRLATKDENISNHETVLLKRNGDLVDVSVTVSPIKDPQGNIVGVSAISRDISERKQVQDSMKKYEEQMRLSQKMDALGRLAGGVAHDFNNLLSVIGGNGDFIKASLPPESPCLGEVGEIENAVRKGAELTKQLLAFGKRQLSQSQIINLNEMGSEMSKMFKRLIDASIHFELIQGGDLRQIQADPGQIQQIILNLVLNARDAMPNGGKLIVTTKNIELADTLEMKGIKIPPGSYVCLTVTDTGVGMDEETQKHLFEPFFTTKGEKGTGLGLATVYGIVRQWEGYLWLYSSPNRGTIFTIYFPATNAQVGTFAGAKKAPADTKGVETILIAEDDAAVRKVIVRTMENLGYHILQAGNGIEAVQVAMNYKDTIHMLLTDTVMPKLNGLELAKELKKDRPQMRVLFMSGYPREILSSEVPVDESINLIQKPFTNNAIAERIREGLDQK